MNKDNNKTLDVLDPEELDAALAEALFDAMSAPGAPDEALIAALDESQREAFDEHSALAALLREDRDAQDPGDHFFEALQGEVMAQLDAPTPRVLRGEPVQRAPEGASSGLLAWVRDLFAARPTLATGLLMAAALVALLLWPRGEHTQAPDPNQDQAHARHTPDLPLDTSLDERELDKLKALAAEIDLGDDEDLDVEDDWQDNAWADESWGGGDWGGDLTGALGVMSGDELKALDEALQRPL